MTDADNENGPNREQAGQSASSRGSQPVLWAIWWHGEKHPDCEFCYADKANADLMAEGNQGAEVVPLCLHPQPTLTDEEREAIAWAASQPTPGDTSLRHTQVLAELFERTR